MKKIFVLVISIIFFSSAHSATRLISGLFLSDIHYVPGLASTLFGKGFHRSDAGDDLFQSLLAEVNTLNRSKHPNFAIVLGDLPGHHLENRKKIDATVLAALSKQLPNLPLFYVAGNNDPKAGNYHSFSAVHPKREVISNALSVFPKHLPAFSVEPVCTAQKQSACIINTGSYNGISFFFGFYSAYLTPKHAIRLIALNSVIFQNSNNGAAYVSDDGVSQIEAQTLQLNWLEAQLSDALKHHDSILLAMHIPPGMNSYSGFTFWTQVANKRFLKLVSRYSTSISLLVAGHTHMNELHPLVRAGTNINTLLIIPGVTPLHGNDPGFDLLAFEKIDSSWAFAKRLSESYRARPYDLRWERYFSFADMDPHNLVSWYRAHFAQGNTGFVPAQGYDAVNASIRIQVP